KRPQIAGPNAIRGHQIQGCRAKLVQAVIELDAVNLRGIHKPLHMFPQPENCRRARGRVATDAFKNGGAVIDDVRHHVDLGVLPRYELSVVPDLFGCLDRHKGGSLRLKCPPRSKIPDSCSGPQGLRRVSYYFRYKLRANCILYLTEFS